MILFGAVVFALLGYAICLRVWPGDRPGAPYPLERACYAGVIATALWLGSDWILALTHTFSRPFLIARTVVATIALLALAGPMVRSLRAAVTHQRSGHVALLLAIALIPPLLWIEFALWRSALVPPLSHDALSYHLPKAVLIARGGGYDHQPLLNPAIRTLPLNYELLLAEEIALSGSDKYTEWPSTVFYLFFIVACGALVQRWWGPRLRRDLLVAILVAATPVVLLHSGAHKNDLPVAAFMVAGLVATGRFLAIGDRSALFAGIASFAMAAGTKPQGGLLALAVAPFILWRIVRSDDRWRTLLSAIVVAAVAFFLLGDAVYVSNLVHEGSLLNARVSATERLDSVPYGDWSSFWRGPYVLLAAPFSTSRWSLWVPWSEQPWFWRRYEIYFSHLGIPFTLAVLGCVFARRGAKRDDPRHERTVITLAALAAFAVMLPVGFIPYGMYQISLPRYALFILPIAFAWGVGPWGDWIAGRPDRVATVLVAAASLWFVAQAVEYGARDTFVPFQYVLWIREHPDVRAAPFDPFRAAEVADRRAGPFDRIAVDSGFGTWIHPAFGAALTRPVDFITDSDPRSIGDDVKWVVVDRAYMIVWRHPQFRDLGQTRTYLGRGTPADEDTLLIRRLQNDPRFVLVYHNPKLNQAVFKRR